MTLNNLGTLNGTTLMTLESGLSGWRGELLKKLGQFYVHICDDRMVILNKNGGLELVSSHVKSVAMYDNGYTRIETANTVYQFVPAE